MRKSTKNQRSAGARGRAANAARNVTIKDIAEHLGIAHSTVSRALSDHPYTNAETKEKVRKAVEALGYVPHSAARWLRGDKGSMIGLVLPDIKNESFAAAAQTLSQRCAKAGMQMVLAVSEDDPMAEYRHVVALREARAGGIILVPSPGLLDKTVALLQSTPVVQYSRTHPKLRAPSVTIDGERGVFIATQHLLQFGHRRIGYIGAEPGKSTGADRLAGFVGALKQLKMPVHSTLQRLGPTNADFGLAAVAELLQLPEPPTALVLGSSAIMPGVLRALRQASVEVPHDMSLVGFGDPSWYATWKEGITTIGLPLAELAEAAASQLMRQISMSTDPAQNSTAVIALEPSFVLRGTTAPFAGSHKSVRSALRSRL
jgi:LacI family transcriptional regulator